MRLIVASACLLVLSACSQQAWYQQARRAECQQNGGSVVSCAGTYTDDYRALEREKAKGSY